MTTAVMTRPAVVCACAVCWKDIFEGAVMADHKRFKCGELSYIELAHIECAKAENAEREARGERAYWEHD
jgi:ribosomal protein S27AE